MAGENNVVIEAWNTILFDKFCRFKHLLIEGLSAHSNEALARRNYAAGSRVLDVGCGFGDSTRLIASRLAPAGAAIGVDCADNFINAARSESVDAGVANASYFVADVQVDDLRGPYDAAFSRFGTMFFMAPGAAMRNIRKALKPGGLLLLEGYGPKQLEYKTGGPSELENLYTEELLRAEFAGFSELAVKAYDSMMSEGIRHVGMAALVDLVARK